MSIPTIGQKGPQQQAPDPREATMRPKVAKTTEVLIDKVIEADINVGDFNLFMELLNKDIAQWFNKKINQSKLSDAIEQERRAEKEGGEKND